MKIFISPQQGGKTTFMVGWLKEDPKRLMLTFSWDEKKRIINHFAKKEIEGNEQLPEWTNRIFTWEELQKNRQLGRSSSGIGVDNADMILFQLLRMPISLITLTGEAYDVTQKQSDNGSKDDDSRGAENVPSHEGEGAGKGTDLRDEKENVPVR